MPNTSYITNTFDGNARLLSTTLKKSDHSTLNSHQYAYNPGNQRTQQVFNAGSTYDYTYDAIGQLKVADSGTASEDRGYTYDSAWNLNYRTNNATLQTFSVDGLNQLTSAPDGSCTYDANGNLTSCGGMALEFGYDDENRLSIIQSNLVAYTNYPFRQTLFAYDGQGRLKVRLELQNTHVPDPGGDDSLVEGGGGGMTWSTNSITRYIYDGWRVIQERDETNEPQVNYTRGTDLSGSLEGAGGIGGLLARSYGYNSGNMLFHVYYQSDGNGNVTYLVSTSQTLAASYRYDPYGNVISSRGGLANVNTYRFSSKEVHLRTGFYYYGHRFYEPSLQRWLNGDPIHELGFTLFTRRILHRGGLAENLFRFVANDSINRADPSGLCDISLACNPAAGGLATHCGVIAPDGSEFQLSTDNGTGRPVPGGGPSGSSGSGLALVHNPEADRTDTNYPVTCDSSCAQVQQCLRNYHDTSPISPYNIFGPNSNTYAHKMLDECGCTVDPIPTTILHCPKWGGPTRTTTTTPPGAVGWNY
ncbi:MAG TPA: RHS repeat-associated core domain-containing protein [Verrucomicrobiae bacterium]|nr:RHS repeat-associated core domain-containing protein [Verrucomicrobiae bacterium]